MTTERNDTPKSPLKKSLFTAARLAAAAAPLVWIYSRADAAAIADMLAAISAPLILAISALYVAAIILQGVKWWALIRPFVPELKITRAVSVHLESSFYSIIIPTAAAVDVVKSVILSKSHSPTVVWAASWLGRLIGLLTMLLYSLFGTIYLKSDALPSGFRTALITSAAIIALLTAASFSKTLTRPLRAAAKLIGPKIMTKIEKLRNGIYAFKYKRGALIQTFMISAAIQFLLFLYTTLIVYAISGEFYLLECLAFVPLVEIIALSVSITPGGIGIREALMALLFARLGFTGDQIASYVTASLLMSALRIVGGVPVLYRHLRNRVFY